MSLFRAQQQRTSWPPEQLVPARGGGNRGGIVPVNTEAAKRHSAVWACLRLRADLISAMPLRVYRQIGKLLVDAPTPPVLSLPGGERVDIMEWMFSSQWDLDSVGNAIGIITKTDGYNLPAQIELQDRSTVTVVVRNGKLRGYRIHGKMYDPPEIWHEKQYTQSGMFVGLSPIAYGALAISEYLSAQQFALGWFTDGAIPMGKLKNSSKTINETEAEVVKSRFKNATANREIFVHGMDWDYEMIQSDNSTNALLETKKYSIADIGRFFGVPGDLLDAEALHASKITYANITQRHLQFLIMHLRAPIRRREAALTRLTPASRFVELDTSDLLSMDPMTLATWLQTRITSRTITPDEARTDYYNERPLTPTQIEQFATLFPSVGGASEPEPDADDSDAADNSTDGSPNEVNAA